MTWNLFSHNLQNFNMDYQKKIGGDAYLNKTRCLVDKKKSFYLTVIIDLSILCTVYVLNCNLVYLVSSKILILYVFMEEADNQHC